MIVDEKNIVQRLIYLWIFAETALGGLMHLLHIPLTGLVLGGFSIVINLLLVKYARSNYKLLWSALFMVLLAKFTFNPYTPIGAYVAVGFQGSLAIILFSLVGMNGITILFYAICVMLENAIQKPLVAYLIFGKELWNGIQSLIITFFKLNMGQDVEIKLLLLIYVLIYLLWGIIVGYWSRKLIHSIENYELPSDFIMTISKEEALKPSVMRKKLVGWTGIVLFVFLIVLLWFKVISWIYILKTIGLLLVFTVLLPFIIQHVLAFFSNKNADKMQTIRDEMSVLYHNFIQIYHYVKDLKGVSKLKIFMYLMIYVNIFYNDKEKMDEDGRT